MASSAADMDKGNVDVGSDELSDTEKDGIEPQKEEDDVPSDYDDDMEAEDARMAKEEGNRLFGESNWTDAVLCYSKALRCAKIDPDERAVFYCNRAAAQLKLSEDQAVVSDCTKALKLRPGYTKALMRRKVANVNLEKYGEALGDLKQLRESATSSEKTGYSIEMSRLETLKVQHEEKQKAEAMKQLKEVGNSFLSMFGMSVDNFKFDQDPATGNYNINFKNNNG